MAVPGATALATYCYGNAPRPVPGNWQACAGLPKCVPELGLLELRAMWMLESTTESPKTLVFRLPPGAIKTVGRAPRADFVVDVPLVSRLHCRLTLQPDGLLVEDLGSTNGTFVNGERVMKLLMRTGDALRVGRMEFSVRQA